MMTEEDIPEDIKKLMAIIMSYDNRKPGLANQRAWWEAFNRGGWTFETARAAVKLHFDRSNEFLMPAHVNAILAEVRKAVRAQFTEDVCPPRELADDPRAEIAWRRQRVADYTQRALEAWANGQPMPALNQRQELGETERPQLTSAVMNLMRRFEVSAENRPAVSARSRRLRNPAALERARRELEIRRRAEIPSEERPR